MTQVLLLILATISYTLFGTFISRAGGHMDANLIATLGNGIGAVVPLMMYFYIKSVKQTEILQTKIEGIIYTVLAGIAIGFFAFFLAKLFEKGGNLSYVIPVIYGGTIALASIFGWLFFKESISISQFAGVTLIIAGIFLVIFSKI